MRFRIRPKTMLRGDHLFSAFSNSIHAPRVDALAPGFSWVFFGKKIIFSAGMIRKDR
ncbi:hypothetical protein M2447_000707 [Ereboglobus sp. PH5-10]|uniref:hypothetical protein n=1 Tax=Ereboglobus sp. PH5-10 TaxID=2940629 RepID=UPI00240651FE|nr:hypothetical protein [Ereboglobus sp. PH5-10]MDF9826625.1 hypothetical protein [Ereboglobus sp. PH5-10]